MRYITQQYIIDTEHGMLNEAVRSAMLHGLHRSRYQTAKAATLFRLQTAFVSKKPYFERFCKAKAQKEAMDKARR